MTEIPKRRRKRPPHAGTAVIWPQGVQAMYDISAPTRWRYEKSGRLPPRDVHLGSKSGWRPETLAAFARSSTTSSDAAAADPTTPSAESEISPRLKKRAAPVCLTGTEAALR